MTADRERDEAEDADRGVKHDHVGDADHHVADDFEEVKHGLAAFTKAGEGEAEDHREEDDLKHGAFGHGLHGVDRDDGEQRLDERGRHDFLGLKAFGGEVKAHARLDDACKEQAAGHGDAGRHGIDEKHLDGDTTELGRVGDAGGTGNDRCQNERNDHHSDQTNEEVAERLKPRLGEGGINERADYDTEREPDHHLPGQTDFYFGGHNLHP